MIEMTRVRSKNASTDGGEKQFEVEITTTGISDWIRIPIGINRLVISVFPDVASSGYIETTNDTIERIELGTEVSEQWALGDVSTTTTDACIPVKAFRAVASTGQIRVVATAQ